MTCDPMLIADPQGVIEWCVEPEPVDYETALVEMDQRAADIQAKAKRERIWLLCHPPLYTAGTSAKSDDLIDARFPVYSAGRGGQYTYHGPGQRVAYLNLDLNQRGKDVRRYVSALESWIINALADFGVAGRRADGRIGIWTDTRDGREAKIAAIGVRVHRWVTLHGVAINVSPDLSHFGGIVPCGISDFGVTSLQDLGKQVDLPAFDEALFRHVPGLLAALERPCGRG